MMQLEKFTEAVARMVEIVGAPMSSKGKSPNGHLLAKFARTNGRLVLQVAQDLRAKVVFIDEAGAKVVLAAADSPDACLDLYQAEVLAKRAEKKAQRAADIASTDKALGLPELSGTEKQIVWAVDLRANFRRYCEERGADEKFLEIAKSKQAAKAKFWIDERNFFAVLAGV